MANIKVPAPSLWRYAEPQGPVYHLHFLESERFWFCSGGTAIIFDRMVGASVYCGECVLFVGDVTVETA